MIRLDTILDTIRDYSLLFRENNNLFVICYYLVVGVGGWLLVVGVNYQIKTINYQLLAIIDQFLG